MDLAYIAPVDLFYLLRSTFSLSFRSFFSIFEMNTSHDHLIPCNGIQSMEGLETADIEECRQTF
jgi:hypothetical protein